MSELHKHVHNHAGTPDHDHGNLGRARALHEAAAAAGLRAALEGVVRVADRETDEFIEARAALAAAPEPAALDVERLVAHLDTIKRSGRDLTPENMGHDMGVAHAQDAIRAYAAEGEK